MPIDVYKRQEQGRFPVNLKLAERSYREDELETIFEQGRLWLDDVWLGENASSQTVIHDLYFPTEIELSLIHI